MQSTLFLCLRVYGVHFNGKMSFSSFFTFYRFLFHFDIAQFSFRLISFAHSILLYWLVFNWLLFCVLSPIPMFLPLSTHMLFFSSLSLSLHCRSIFRIVCNAHVYVRICHVWNVNTKTIGQYTEKDNTKAASKKITPPFRRSAHFIWPTLVYNVTNPGE